MRVAAPPLLPIFRSRLQGELLALVLVDVRERKKLPHARLGRELGRHRAAELEQLVLLLGRAEDVRQALIDGELRPSAS